MSRREKLVTNYAILLIVSTVFVIYTVYEALYLAYTIYVKDYKEMVQAIIFLAISSIVAFISANVLEKRIANISKRRK